MALGALKFVIQEEAAPKTRIRVFGVGGGGSQRRGAHAATKGSPASSSAC